MADQVVENLKKAKSSLKQERKPVSQVVAAQKTTASINEFVKAALAEENRWVLNSEEQKSIVDTLKDIKRIFRDLYEQCRTPHHFEKDPAKFISMQQEINRLTSCIHLSLDQGYYLTEPRGFSPGKAVELSWEQIQVILKGEESSGKWARLPLSIEMPEEDRSTVKKLGGELREHQEKLKQNPRLNSFEEPLSIEDIQSVYQYFQKVHQILEMEHKVLDEAVQIREKKKKVYELEEAQKQLDQMEVAVQSMEKKLSRDIPEFSRLLYDASRTDALLRLSLLRVPFEPLGMIERHLQNLKKDHEEKGAKECLDIFNENHKRELEHLQLFLETFGAVAETLHQVNSILSNLSISFGKIYLSTSADTINSSFLQRALGSIRGLLEKGLRVTGTRKEMLVNIQNAMRDTDLFGNPIVEGLLYTLDLIEEAREQMNSYLEQLGKHLNLLGGEEEWSPKRVYIMMKDAYEDRTSVSSAAMILENVTQTCELFYRTLKEIRELWNRITDALETSSDPEEICAKLEEILGSTPDSFKEMMDESMRNVEELQWVHDEMLDAATREEHQFLTDLQAEMEPVHMRIQANKKKKASQQQTEPKLTQTHKTVVPLKKKAPSPGPTGPTMGSGYDPFPPEMMGKLKGVLKDLKSHKGKMLNFVMTHNHMFFNMLEKLESTFDPESWPGEYQLQQTMMKSKTTNDFLINIARMKFLKGGYFNPHNVPYDYDVEAKKFLINKGSYKFLQLAKKSFETPENLYSRLIRILLGLDPAELMNTALGRQTVAILEEDFMLSRDEIDIIKDALAA